MAEVTQERPQVKRVGAYAWCEQDGRVLLSRYAAPDGRWALPGGGVEHGEAPEEAVLRELVEETGLTGRVLELLGIRSDVWSLPTVSIHNLAVVYRVEIIGGTLRAEVGGSSDAADWFLRDRLTELPRNDLLDWTRNQFG